MAKKTESTFINMFLSLFVVTALASLALAGVYNLTYEPIARVEREKKEEAIKLVLPEFDSLRVLEVKPVDGDKQLVFNEGLMGDSLVGVAVQTYTTKGYSGYVELMVGFLPDGRISKIEVLQQKETPGLGTKMTSDKFRDQFYDKDPAKFRLKVKKDGGDVDAITAATISSRAFCDAVQRAYDTYKKEEGGKLP
jgi:electron transport complex protein RnfG